MPQSTNQKYLELILDTMRLVVSDGRLTYGDALHILEGLLSIDWQKDNEVLADQPEPPTAQKAVEKKSPSGALPWNWLK